MRPISSVWPSLGGGELVSGKVLMAANRVINGYGQIMLAENC